MSADWTVKARAIRAFYAHHRAAILAKPGAWAMDPYAWSHDAGIFLTPIEAALWDDIRMCNAVMYPQYPIGPYFADFAHPCAKVVIECDGARWHQDQHKDAQRQAAIESLGWTVYRITGRDCFSDTVEGEDEGGNAVFEYSAARRFMMGICARHPIQRSNSTEIRGPVPLATLLQEALARYVGRAEGFHA